MDGTVVIEFTFKKFSEAWKFVDALEAFAADEHPAEGIKLTTVNKSVESA